MELSFALIVNGFLEIQLVFIPNPTGRNNLISDSANGPGQHVIATVRLQIATRQEFEM